MLSYSETTSNNPMFPAHWLVGCLLGKDLVTHIPPGYKGVEMAIYKRNMIRDLNQGEGRQFLNRKMTNISLTVHKGKEIMS